MHTIQNEVLSVAVQTKGAELSSIYHKAHKLEYMWNGNPAFWAKKSPVLFPIVGALKQNSYLFEDKTYELPRHGFAREMEFRLAGGSDNELTFRLESNADTLRSFPFQFNFNIRYRLDDDCLRVSYVIENTGNNNMYFSVGGHPAFKVPLVESTSYDDYYLEFNSIENAGRWPVTKDGLIDIASTPLLQDTGSLALSKELFLQDALVFKHLSSTQVALKSKKTSHGLDFDFTGFPYLGIWAAPNADFVCIEPWCGIADAVGSNRLLVEKEGINVLGRGELFERTWKVKMY